MSLENKIDFALIFSVKNANPNGDPLNGNRPRTDYDGYGEISDVCLKRKLRDRLQDAGQAIFVQSDEKKTDGMTSLQNRAYSDEVGLGKDAFNAKKTPQEQTITAACEKWFDVRSFGQIFAYKGEKKGEGCSIPIRGAVSIHSAFSTQPVSVTSTQITKSVSGEGDGDKKSSDTMGMKHRIDAATFVTYGAMSPQLAQRTGFTNEDAEVIKTQLTKLFEGDASSARPEGSMTVDYLVWWQHNNSAGQYSSGKVHNLLRDYIEEERPLDKAAIDDALQTGLPGLAVEVIEGF